MNISINWAKQKSNAHTADDQQTRRSKKNRSRQKPFKRSNEGIARRAYKDRLKRMQRWGVTDLLEWWNERARKRRQDQKRTARKANHLARMERDPKFRAKMKKQTRDYLQCRLNSCHNVDEHVYAMAEHYGIE